MKALILCAGKGTRLQPITYSLPKHVIPIANQPIVFHIIKKLVLEDWIPDTQSSWAWAGMTPFRSFMNILKQEK